MQNRIEPSKEFMNDLPKLSSMAVKIYIIFMHLKQMTKKEKETDDFTWIRCGYQKIINLSGVKSKVSIRKFILELAKEGWISNFRRGGFSFEKGKKTHVTNFYKIPDNKVSPPDPMFLAVLSKDTEKIEKLSKKKVKATSKKVRTAFKDMFEEEI